MKAFHNDPLIRDKYIARIHEHFKADELIKGQYWQNGKGCAVGCTIHSDDHSAYETELGIPEWLARVEDSFFENLPNEAAKEWPVKFLEAVNIGADLNKVKVPFIIYILNENLATLDALKVDEEHKDVIAAIEQTKLATRQMITAQETGVGVLRQHGQQQRQQSQQHGQHGQQQSQHGQHGQQHGQHGQQHGQQQSQQHGQHGQQQRQQQSQQSQQQSQQQRQQSQQHGQQQRQQQSQQSQQHGQQHGQQQSQHGQHGQQQSQQQRQQQSQQSQHGQQHLLNTQRNC